MRYCDHIFIEVKELHGDTPLPDNYHPGMIIPSKKGKLLVCHFCGKRKEVWEDGTIVDLKANHDEVPR